MTFDSDTIIMSINFFILAFTLLALYYYVYRLRFVLRRSEKLRQLAEKYRILFDSTTEGVFQSDMEGNLILLNRGGANLLGFKDQDELVQGGFKATDFYSSKEEGDEYPHQQQKEKLTLQKLDRLTSILMLPKNPEKIKIVYQQTVLEDEIRLYLVDQ